MVECEGLALIIFARNENWQDDQGGLARVATTPHPQLVQYINPKNHHVYGP